MNAKKSIVNIAVEDIVPHPDNPRKDLGDLTELQTALNRMASCRI